MFKSITVLEELILLNKSLEKCIEAIKRRNMNAPEGSLRIINKWNKYQYYHRINPSENMGKYIPRKDRPPRRPARAKGLRQKAARSANKPAKGNRKVHKRLRPGRGGSGL